jgi:hypothetical protein
VFFIGVWLGHGKFAKLSGFLDKELFFFVPPSGEGGESNIRGVYLAIFFSVCFEVDVMLGRLFRM